MEFLALESFRLVSSHFPLYYANEGGPIKEISCNRYISETHVFSLDGKKVEKEFLSPHHQGPWGHPRLRSWSESGLFPHLFQTQDWRKTLGFRILLVAWFHKLSAYRVSYKERSAGYQVLFLYKLAGQLFTHLLSIDGLMVCNFDWHLHNS